MHNCTSTNQFQPAAFPWQETVICHWKPFFHVSNSLSSFIRRPTVTQCNTEWPEWSKQSLYNTPVTLMVGQLCDTLCVKLCDNMWHCVLQCVTLYDTLWHSVTLCDSGSVCHWWPRWLVICDTVLHHRFVHRQPWCSIIWWDTTGRDWYGLAQLVQYDLFLQMFYDLLDINS